jgi:hypothetical protein
MHSTHRQKRHTTFLLGNLKGRDHLEDLGVDGDIIKRTLTLMKYGSG